MLKYKKINLISNGCFILAFLLLFFLNFYTFEYLFFPDDAVQCLFFSQNILKNGTPNYYNPLNSQFEKIFGMRGFYILDNGQSAPNYMLGNIILTAIFMGISKYALYLFNLTFCFLLFVFFYKTINLFLKNKVKSKIITLLLAFFAPFLFYASVYTNVLPAASFFLIAVYFSLKFVQNKNKKYFYLFLLFSLLTFWIRYEYIILFVPFFFYIIYSIKNKKIKFKFTHILWSILIISLLIFPFIYYNLSTYDGVLGFLTSNATVLRDFEHTTIIKEQNILFFQSGDFLFHNVKTQILNNFIFIPIIFFLYLISLITIIKKKEYTLLTFYSIPLIQIIYYYGAKWGGYNIINVVGGSSYIKYILPSWIIMFFLASYLLINLSNKKNRYVINKKVLIVVFLVFIVLNLNFVIFSCWGLQDYHERIENVMSFREEILQNTPDDSILFLKYLDKEIFPLRETAIYQSFPQDTRRKQVTSVIKNLLDNGYDIYFVNEDKIIKKGYSFREYKKYFEEEGLNVSYVFSSNIYKVDFYKIEKGD